MKSEYVKYGVYFLLAALFVMFIQLYFPNPINWEKNFSTQNKDPYGLYVFDNELPELLKNQKITKTALTPYEYYPDSLEIKNSNETTFLVIENSSNFDEVSAKSILDQVNKGADLVISTENFYNGFFTVLDTLDLKIDQVSQNNLYFVNDSLSNENFTTKDNYNNVFLVKNPNKHTAIAKLDYELAFIATKFGKGTIYLNTTPILLTNYYLLNKDNDFSGFTESFASVIKKKNVVWFDVNYSSNERENNQSLLRFLFKNKSLRFAWYTLIASLLLFVIFYGKRKQRIIPIIEPVKNTTVEYLETVGNLYFQENDITQILQKQIQFSLYFIRNNLKIPTQNIDTDFKEKLQQKTLANSYDIDAFVKFIQTFNVQQKYTQQQLIQFNQLLEKLKINYGKYRK